MVVTSTHSGVIAVCDAFLFDCRIVPRSWLAAASSLTLCWVLCAVASLLFLAWMRTAVLAGGIAVVRSGMGYVEDGDEVLHIVLWRLGYRPDRLEHKKR